ncbi:MAG: isoprenylcysteine carboxylmethyltransferase family protein [Acidobacteriaceae bacterium]|nr:isoprenylcysteine carboxylmethyltransferase family protein [Acidobacteriaceae bacterium]
MSVALKITWAIFVIVWIIGAFTSKRSLRRQSWASRFGMVAVAILEYLLLFWGASYFGFAYQRFLPDSTIYLWVGQFMTIAGVAFAIWARVTLGQNWSGIVTVKQDHELIRTGPYRLVRHPIYTGITLAVFGTAMFDGEIRSIILMVAMLSVLTQKMKIEEQFMNEQFGSEYAGYRQKTKALVPFLW